MLLLASFKMCTGTPSPEPDITPSPNWPLVAGGSGETPGAAGAESNIIAAEKVSGAPEEVGGAGFDGEEVGSAAAESSIAASTKT